MPRAGRFVASVIQADDAEQDDDEHAGTKEQSRVSQPAPLGAQIGLLAIAAYHDLFTRLGPPPSENDPSPPSGARPLGARKAFSSASNP